MATTVVNSTPGTASSEDNGVGMMLGIILFVVVMFLLLFYGIPLFRSSSTQNVPNSTGGNGGSVNLPGKVDVNVKTPGKY